MTSGISGIRSTLAESAVSRFDDDRNRMEAALAMTQMSEGDRRNRTRQFAAVSADRRKHRLRFHRDPARRHERLNRRIGQDSLVGEQSMASSMSPAFSKSIQLGSSSLHPQRSSLPDVVQRSSDGAGGMEDVGCSTAEILPDEHRDRRDTTSRDGKAVDGAMLARMTREVLERPSDYDHATVGKFFRTCGRWDNTTAVAPQTLSYRLLSNCVPSPASQRPKVSVAVSHGPTEERRASKDGRQRPQEIRRSSDYDRAPVGKFIRTCSQRDNTTGVATLTLSSCPLSNYVPSPASQRPRVSVAVSDGPTEQRRASKDGRQRPQEIQRSSSDEVDGRRASQSLFGPVLERQSSDPSERQRSPPPTIRSELSDVSVSNRHLRFPDRSSSPAHRNHAERSGLPNGSRLVLPVQAVGEGTPCWGLVPLSVLNVGPCGSAFQLSVPQLVALQEEEGVPSSFIPVGNQIRLSFAEPDVAVTTATMPLHDDNLSSNFVVRDSRTSPKHIPTSTAVPPVALISEKRPVNGADKCDSAILKAMESVKVEDQIRPEADMDIQPLDLTRSAPNLAVTNGTDQHRPPKSSKYDRFPTLEHGRSSSYGSLFALKAFYDDLSTKSASRKIGPGSSNCAVADTVARPAEETPSAICEPAAVAAPAENAQAAKVRAIQNDRNADVLDAWRSEFRPRPNQRGDQSSSLVLSSRTAFDPALQRTPNETNRNENWKQGTTDVSTSPTDLRRPRITKAGDADLDFQLGLHRSTGDATVMGSKTETGCSSAELEKRFNGGPPVTEANCSPVDFRESPPLVKIPVNEQPVVAIVEENGDQNDRSRIIEEGTSKTSFDVDCRPVTHDDLSSPPPKSGSLLNESNSSRDNLDLSWRLPPKKRRMLDSPVLPSIESKTFRYSRRANSVSGR